MTKDCLFNKYDLDGLDGDNRTYSFGQLIGKCKCQGCKEIEISLKKYARKRNEKIL